MHDSVHSAMSESESDGDLDDGQSVFKTIIDLLSSESGDEEGDSESKGGVSSVEIVAAKSVTFNGFDFHVNNKISVTMHLSGTEVIILTQF